MKIKISEKFIVASLVALMPIVILIIISASISFVAWSIYIPSVLFIRIGTLLGIALAIYFWVDTDEKGKVKDD